MKNIFKFLLVCSMLAVPIFSNAFQSQKSQIVREGDTFSFVGDSITHSGAYPKYIRLFYATRFPHLFVNFINSGISGDNAAEISTRMDDDILSQNPTVASLMVGMNDVGRHFYGVDMNSDWYTQKRAEAIDNYKKNVSKCIDALAKDVRTLILFTPSIYDEVLECKTENNVGVNGALFKCGEFTSRYGEKFKNTKRVDMWSKMSEVSKVVQASDKTQTIVGIDRVHPQDGGGFVMACAFIGDIGENACVSEIAIDGNLPKVEMSLNCDVSSLKKNSFDGISWRSLEGALPYPLSGEPKKLSQYVDFEKKFNREILQVKNLKDGMYSLLIDGAEVGKYDAKNLAEGINLSVNENTPQYKQALEVEKICRQLQSLEERERSLHFIEVFYIKTNNKTDPEKSVELCKKYLEENSAKVQSAYILQKLKDYVTDKPKQKEFFKQKADLDKLLYKSAKPAEHAFEIRKI